MRALVLTLGAGLGLAALVAACAPEAGPGGARADFAAYCAACHGNDGRGGGPLAEGMEPVPADVTLITRRNGGVFPKAQVMGHIAGYTMGRSESPMPQFSDLLEGPQVMFDDGSGQTVPTPARLVALADYVQSLQR
ncbi:cytochrome c [Paracoccus bogoriensis]|uniref:cytochrome c n=1 Tax=Paracoccus bogoriensis TaxID=242065 RepID=UPI001CA5B642|nr:cytochrome c [Paracoccus bogoriensis]MBW7056267.1 cytochrome c [Paracoccus bogoriensis]